MKEAFDWVERNPWITFFLLIALLDGIAKICHAITGRGCP